MQDDPHTAFQDMTTLAVEREDARQIFDAFMADCLALPDPSGAERHAGRQRRHHHLGRHPEGRAHRRGWPDSTAYDHNLLYVMGNGYLKTGWFGNLGADGTLTTWDPNTGRRGDDDERAARTYADVGGAYAIAKGDTERVQDFNGTAPPGAIVAGNGV